MKEIIHTIHVEERRKRNGLTLWRAWVNLGIDVAQATIEAVGCERLDAVGFLVRHIEKNPYCELAHSVGIDTNAG